MLEPRAVIFDLDDTLYAHREFVLSGFRAIAASLREERGADPSLVFKTLASAFKSGARGREIQVLCEHLDLPMQEVPRLVNIIRDHTPSIRLPKASAHTLRVLGRDWRIGVLTNGLPAVQARKAAALGLAGLVDAVVFAGSRGTAWQKPAASAFFSVLERLGATPASAVFVGDDVHADMRGAASVGMRTIHLVQGRPGACDHSCCDAHVRSLAAVMDLAAALLEERSALRVA